MRVLMRRMLMVCALVVAAGCGDDDGDVAADAGNSDAPPAVAPEDRDIVSTALEFDLTAMTGRATISLAPGTSPTTTFEVGDLAIMSVTTDGVDAPFSVADAVLTATVGANAVEVVIEFAYSFQNDFEGAMSRGMTLVWPYYCGNLFPCDSDPDDGTSFSLALTGVPDGKTAIFPASIPADAPSYMIAWAVGEYTTESLGTTTDGTVIEVYYLPGGQMDAIDGTDNLVEIFDWLETTYGPYSFGDTAGPVSVVWGPGAFGGMEHHPLWHTANIAMGDQETQAHEAAHGWFGNGIRIACWEDFVLSEGAAAYLAARGIGEAAGPAIADLSWQGYQARLNRLQASSGNKIAWPEGCNEIDILEDGLFNDAPYMKGAFFLLALEDKLGVEVLDAALSAFYMENVGSAAGMQDLLDLIASMTGYDPTACANGWLRSEDLPDPALCK